MRRVCNDLETHDGAIKLLYLTFVCEKKERMKRFVCVFIAGPSLDSFYGERVPVKYSKILLI